ncbi:isoaspartyl peptidase/L-asparaginase family protein [Adhaeribacter soli]|uniref:Isoaspartyl peptidase n=1 Tax=Adhaeribacter soli TaxID=2607655 RepID=A0A5N1ISN3_9BACT|nr:isoaspartyl peptidase/L-asparaginase [Adhaeribacter soli]KAA9331120.1 isoaspartyl peptidase/L-asparaginase [Adhaeribacter soli]
MRRLLFLLTLSFSLNFMANAQKTYPITLVIHGGAGNISRESMTPDKEKAYTEGLNAALAAGYAVLEKGGTSLDAVEAAVRVMEDNPLFNAGKGAVFTNEGKNELDAAIMDGATLKAGSVASVTTIRNPITAARTVMEKSPHVMMVGKGAEKFAKEQKLEIVNPSYFYSEPRFKQLQKAKEEDKQTLDHSSDTTGSTLPIFMEGKKFGTVGAVALDKYGNLAAATSTGGMTNKRYGRVGDAPIIGAGTYANNKTCAVSATGHGEFFIRYTVAHDISALMEYKHKSLRKATEKVVLEKLLKAGGEGGVIAVDRKGKIAMPFNSNGMFRAYKTAKGETQTLIFKE